MSSKHTEFAQRSNRNNNSLGGGGSGSGATYKDKGNYDASLNSPNLETPVAGAVKAGDGYTVSVAGVFFTEILEVGDVIIARQDDPSAIGHWNRLQFNINGEIMLINTTGVLHVSTGNVNATDTRTDLSNYSSNQPYKTIQKAIDDAGANELIVVHAGTYTQNLTVKSNLHIYCNPNVTISASTTVSTIKGVGVTNFKMSGYAEVIYNQVSYNEACFEFTTASSVDIEVFRTENMQDAFGALKITGGTTMNFVARKETRVNFDGVAQYCAYIENSDLNYSAPFTINNVRGENSTTNPAFRFGGTLTANRTVNIKTNYKYVPKATNPNNARAVVGVQGGLGANYATAGFTNTITFDGDCESVKLIQKTQDNFNNPVALGTKYIFRNGKQTLPANLTGLIAPSVWLENVDIEFINYIVQSFGECFDGETSNGATMRAYNTRFLSGRAGGGSTQTQSIATAKDVWVGTTITIVDCQFEVGASNTNGNGIDSALTVSFTGLRINNTYGDPTKIVDLIAVSRFLINADTNAINYPQTKNPFIVERQNYLCFSEQFDNIDGLLTPINQVGRWSNQSSLVTSMIANNAHAPSGARKAYTVTVSGNGIILRQKTASNFTNGGNYTFTGWVRRVSGDGNITLDIADGAGSGTITMTTGVWVYINRALVAGAGDFFDFNMGGASGATIFDITEFQLNDGTTPLEYTRTQVNRITTKYTGQRPRNIEIGMLWQNQVIQEIFARTVTANNYTLTNADFGRTIELSNASAFTITVPTGLRSDFACKIIQTGAGQGTYTASGTTLRPEDTGFLKTEKQHTASTITRATASETFNIAGRLVP